MGSTVNRRSGWRRAGVAAVLALIIARAAATSILLLPSFGALPSGQRLQCILSSACFREGEFRNVEPTKLFTEQ
ncbi:MAG: hypothetical protein JSR96_00935 [Proteobacteria bacterium]|nr:hypothetical protein [Pseudomonadota bacterium]